MSKKRVTKKSWDSDEELLNDTPGNSITAPYKTSEPSLSEDNRMLDEDALLSVEEAGMRTLAATFGNDPANSLATSQGLQDTDAQEATYQGNNYVVDQPAFVFEETDNAYLDDEMNIGGSSAIELAATKNGTWGEVQHNVDGLSTQGNASDAHEDMSITDLEQEQPVKQEKSGTCESGSDSEAESSHHTCGKFKSERSGVISLTPTTVRDSVPETLEINEEQAAQLKQFLPDKSNKGRGKTRGQGRPSAHSRLGMRPGGVGLQQNPQVLLNQFLRGVLGPQPRMGFPFPGGSPNRGPFPAGILNTQGRFPVRPVNRGTFSGQPQNMRGLLPSGSFNMPNSAPQGAPSLRLPQGRFPGTPNQRGPFIGGPQQAGLLRMPPGPPGPQPNRGLPPNQLRFQSFPNQRMVNPGQFGQKPPLLGQQGIRPPVSGLGISGPRPLLGNAGPGMRFPRPNHPPAAAQQGQSIPLLVNQVANALKSSLGFQQLRPGQGNSFMMPNANNRPPALMQNVNRFQHPIGQPQGNPRFMGRMPVSGGPFVNQPLIRGNRQPLLGGQGGFPMAGKPRIFINPRFQNLQNSFGVPGIRPFRMGIPMQQRRAKVLLEKAKQTQNKHAVTVPMKLTGIKRKSTGGDDVPSKVVKPDENAPAENSETTSATIVAADSAC